jgi:hypothetical protein
VSEPGSSYAPRRSPAKAIKLRWKTFLDRDFNVRLHEDAIGFPGWTILDQQEDDSKASRQVTALPKMARPRSSSAEAGGRARSS